MKRKYVIIVMLLVLSGLFTIQSCTKEDTTPLKIVVAAVPDSPNPAINQVVPLSGTSYTIKWTGTATSWDVYLGTSSKPGLAKSGVTGNSYTFTTTAGGEFWWYVKTKDVNNVTSTSPTWNFYINSAPTAPVLKAPADAAVKFSITGALTWNAATDAEGDAITYDVYLGTTSTPGIVTTGVAATTYSPTLLPNTAYYWKVVAKDSHGATATSTVSSFTTGPIPLNFSVFNGVASELCASFSASATNNVTVTINTTGNFMTLYLPIADAMVNAGWGTAYSGTHPIIVYYNPVTLAITGTKQPWTDSFIDPIEMGPMSLTVKSGTIDPINKKFAIVWTLSGNDYWGGDYSIKTATYTMK